MNKTETEIDELLAKCDAAINSGETNSLATYEEGVRDAIMWLLYDSCEPYVGREE